MNLFKICGEKIENVKRALVVETLFQIHSFLPLEPQSEFVDKHSRRDQFKKRQKSAQKERRKEHNRTLNLTKKVNKDKKQRTRFVHQGIFGTEIDKEGVKNSITSLFVDVEQKVKESFADPQLVAAISTKMAAAISAMHLLKGEKRPSKIVATLTLALTSIMPELTQRSVTGTLNFSSAQINYFRERFGFNPFEQQADFDDNNKNIAWLSKLPEYLNNWEAAKQSPAFSKISELISIIATMGFIDGKRLCVSVKGLELFRLGTIKKHADVTDLVSAVLSSLEYFISGGYEFFLTGSPRRFLFDDQDAKEFDDLYEMLLEATPHAKSMNLPIMRVEFKGEKIIMDDTKYLEHLESAIKLCKKCKKLSKNTWQTSFFQTRLDRMIGWRADYNARRSNGKFRKAPLSIWIYGTSGVGKSALSQLLIKSLLSYMGVPDEELDRVASINEQDKYDSTITGGVHAYLTDDVMNTKAEYLETAPTQKIVDHNNNAPLFANKAEIEGKGVTPHNPLITCYTSNRKIEEVANQYSNCTESIRRRMIINLDARVKKEFCIPGETRMDSGKVIEKFGTNPMPDIWEFVISECASSGQNGMVELGRNFQHSLTGGHKFNIYEVMEYCYMKADDHMKNQNVLHEIQSSLVEKLNLCKTCKRVGAMCVCDPNLEIPRSEPQGIISTNDSESSLDVLEKLNNIPCLPDDNIRDALAVEAMCQNPNNIIEGYDREEWNAHLLDFENQANLIPPPQDWFRNDTDLEAPIELQAVHVPLWSIIPGMNRQEIVRTFQASFHDLVAWMEFMPIIFLNFGDILIARFFTHRYVRRIYWALWSHIFTDHIRNVVLFCGLGDIILTSAFYILFPYRVFTITFALLQVFLSCTAIVLIVRWYRDRMSLLDRIGGGVQRTYREIRTIRWREVAKWLSVGIIAYKVLSMICNALKARKLVNSVLEHQSALEPEDEKEIKDRDSKISDWAKPAWEELHVTHKARTTTIEQLKNKVAKNLYHVYFAAEDGKTNKCDGLVIEGNDMMVPLHAFGSKTKLKVACRLKEGDGLNTVFRGYISLNMASVVEGVDLVLASAPFLNPHASLVDYFPEKITHSKGAGYFMYRDEDGSLRDDNVAFKTSMRHSGGTGYTYVLPYKTFNGLCMGVLIGEFDVPCIAGVHLLGSPGTPVGLALNVTQKIIADLKEGMKSKPCMNAMSNGDFPKELYGIEVVNQSSPIHPNSPLNYLPKYSKITAVGECPGRSSHTKSSVHKTIISDLVDEVCGVPCTWGAPKFNSKRQWQASMQYSANTSCGLDPELLEWAMNDYEEDLVNAFTQSKHVKWIKEEFKPLNDMEIMTGRDGARFLDAVPKNTSKGFPLSGPKEEWIERLDPDAFEEFQCPVAIRQEVLDLAADMCERFRRGERAYAIFKACVKDEPTPLSKDKVRVFQAASWAFQLLVRKYFLPLARLMSLFPLQSECAVGINAHGPEWDEYAKFMKQHGDDRILAGDYSKFDLRMPAQMLMATYKVFCNVCEKCGTYSEDDLTIMRGIATEISYSVVAYNGDLIIHNGSHPSGNNMTVYGNCGDNCLNFRCGFAYNGLKNGYTLKTLPKFKSVCALGTYGDDAKGSVKKGFDWFNHITFADYMAKNDIVFTMPDKESTPTKYMKDTDADFLKRKNVFNEETGLIHGALDEDSIFKSLHTVLKSSVGAKRHAAGNIETALREWFHHGRDVFTLRHKQMIEVAERAQLQNLSMDVNEETGVIMNSLYDDYDTRLAQFKVKHFDS
ncbi:predicted replication-associated protein [Chaetoceros tenuissimus RNA virus type II]|uniref:Predicted replication-associated protein n=1 Tax=Chaetoceros tenuissimus RNA virus type II TaxID=1516128 RepID=A0A0B6VHZ4_9VIRU|nr:predicted replication-associated protein [Chaetoceros tenuissimus RNA virus type II]BAP99818.1 predicted replication-associated protein [Chaetoceros tenuissimus RNA virus type II]